MWTALLGWTAYISIKYPRWNAAKRGKISSFNAVKMAKVVLFAGGESHLEC
jgi:hypothetical protein